MGETCEGGLMKLAPVFASADDDEGTDDDAGEGDGDAHGDARHRPLVQVVEAVREGCNGRSWLAFPQPLVEFTVETW